MKTIKLAILLFLVNSFNLHAQILFSETFSTSLGQCSSTNSVSGAWVFANSCSFSSSTGHSATGHALFLGSSCQFGNGSNTVSGNLNTPTIAIGPSGAVLTFNYRLVNECGSSGNTCTYDVLKLQISNNGGTSFTDIMSSNGSPAGLTNNGAWTAVTYTLNSYSNQTIIIRFNFNSVDGIGNAYDGVYVDDIIVTGNCFINLTSVPGNSTVTPIICAGNNLTLTTNAVSNYSWSNGATTPSIVVAPGTNTMYSVIGTSSANCVSSASLSVQVNTVISSLSIVNTASATGGTCPNASVTLTAGGANTYTWSGGSGPVTNGVAFVPTTAATYTVVGANACGTSSSAVSLSIHALPTVTAIASTASLCSGSSATLTGIGTATLFNWIGGAGGITNGVGFFPSTSANYTCIGTGAKSCTASATSSITVVTTPSVSPVSNPPTICIGSSSTLTATGATNYTWLPNNASTSSIVVSPTAVVNTYTVIRSNANCVTTQTLNVFVNQLPTVFGIATPVLVCAGKPSTLAVGGALTYTWTGQTPSYTFTGASPVVSPPVTNIYTVVGTDANGCKNSATVQVATDPNPTVTIAFSSSVICNGQSVTMTASGGINYTWTSTSGTVNTATFSDTPTAPTLYNVTADNSFSCFTTVSQIVLVNPTPTLNVAVTKTLVCSGGASTITASGANTYTWDAAANNATTAATVVNPIATTIYTVQGMLSATQCQSTKTVEVKVFTPTITVTNPTNTCYGGNIVLVASGANPNSYNWNIGNGFVNPFQTIAVTPTVFTIYTVSAVSGSNGVNCPSTQTTSIGIFYNPTITATPQRTLVCRGESVQLYGNGGVSYSWSNAQTGATITVNPVSNTNYTVTGTDANGCVNTGTIQVKISNCTGINEFNALTTSGLSVYPNPNNGHFILTSNSDIQVNLVNELGQTLRTLSLNSGNNHQVNISDLSAGVYFVVGLKKDQAINQKIIVTK